MGTRPGSSRAALVLAAATAVILGACASTDYGQRDVGERPLDGASSEASFWMQMDEYEDSLAGNGKVIEDAALQAFIEELTCDVAGAYCGELRPYIITAPNFNASMAPNGMMLVHSGLLLRAETADEVAFVLSHEFVHYQENHTLERYGAMKNANRAGVAVSSVLIGAGGGGLGDLAYMAAIGGAMGFSRAQESEADIKGLTALAAAGYNTGSSVDIWQNLLDELKASDKRTKRTRVNRGTMFDTHPVIEARIADLDLQSAAWAPVETDAAAYRAIIRPHLKDWIDAEISNHDYGATLQLIGRLLGQKEDLGILNAALGRTLTLRGSEGDDLLATEAFEAAIAFDDVPAEAHRSLGELYRAAGRNTDALAAYDGYLAAAPEAPDVALIQSIRDTLGEATQ